MGDGLLPDLADSANFPKHAIRFCVRVLQRESPIMATATPTKKRSSAKSSSGNSETVRLQSELDKVKAELKNVHGFLDEIQKFSDVVYTAKQKLKFAKKTEFDLSGELSEVRAEIRSLKELIDSANDGMLAIVEPGPAQFLPLFDRMEKPDVKKHGSPNAAELRERPIAVLRISPLATNVLLDADIVFVGQLQDLIVADPDDWWEEIDGMSDAIAAARVALYSNLVITPSTLHCIERLASTNKYRFKFVSASNSLTYSLR